MPQDEAAYAYTQPRLTSEAFDASRFHVTRMTGVETISRPFRFDLTIVDPGHTALALAPADAGDDAIALDELVGARVTLEMVDQDGEVERRIHGLISEVDDDADPLATEEAHFRVTVVPRLWQASLVKLTEVYLAQSIPEIVREKLRRLGLGDAVDLRLQETYETREFVTQYEETDLDFIHRITEHLGISYFFEHDDRGDDRVVFTDHPDGFTPLSAGPISVHDTAEERGIFGLRVVQRLTPKRFIQHDYNYRQPETELLEQSELSEGFAGGHAEYGGHARTPAEAQHLARVRKERAAATRRRFAGRSDVGALAVGHVFTIDNHPQLDGAEVLITELRHEAHHPRSFSGKGAEPARYRSEFIGTPAPLPFRPEVLTPRPRIAGVLTALVEPGPKTGMGEYARMDDDGRYTVRFTFDTAPYGEQKFSHPVRRAQPYGGTNEGMHFPLKPGVEVCLAFTNGDPDRPIIVGSLPNPTTPSVVTGAEAQLNRIRTANGVKIEFGRVGG
ncbi:MAG: type VI secretion system tip protein TssI/VgrG [Myxococcota bacterium]